MTPLPDGPPAGLVLVTGATGYVGGRLVPRLLESGHRVRCLVRDRARLEGRPWADRVEIVAGDVLSPETLPSALEGVSAAYYLIHSLGGGHGYPERDRRAALHFASAAKAAGVKRLIYLGGLGDPRVALSAHLRSRQDTGAALREAGVPVTEFRAAVIVGSGSLSFEMVRYLTERLPVMICPRWVYTRIQPIGIRDVIEYLTAALGVPATLGLTIEIGGADVLTYADMMLGYARERGLRRRLQPVPFLTPRLSSYWIHLVTPIPTTIARPLIDGLRSEVVVRSDTARRLFPQIRPISYQEAVHDALVQLETGEVATAWSDALVTSQGDLPPVRLTTEQGMILERRTRRVDAPPDAVFRAFTGLGGSHGWLFANWAWQVRGRIDRLAGGIGLRRGRRHPREVRVGDALDFWRVEAIEPGRRMRLRAEMKLPGRAWLDFAVAPLPDGSSQLTQTAYFAPKGLAGHVYWYVQYPAHAMIFSGMIRRLAQRAEAAARTSDR